MSRDIDPKYVKYPNNSEYGYGPDGYKYNRQGGMTAESKRLKNIREQNAEKQRLEKEAPRERRVEQPQSRPARSYGGSSPSLGGLLMGTAGLALPFVFNGVLVIILALLGKIFSPVMPLLELIWELVWMFLTCWLRVFKIWFTGAKYGSFFRDLRIRWVFPIEMAIAVIFLLKALFRSIRNDDYLYEGNKSVAPLIIFPVLELLHSFTTIGLYNSYGHLKSIANGLFLGMQVLIVMGWIIHLIDRIKY